MKWFNKKPKGRTVSIFIDAEKAFDTVWHDGLRKIIFDAKIPIKIVRIISNFLDNRYGQVKVNGSTSMKFPLKAGVPQGSILSPLLYIFFIRLLPTKLSNEIMSSFYTDDICYSASDNNHKSRTIFAATHLQEILIELENFCSKWRIKLNPDKTVVLNSFNIKENDNTPRLWLRGELLKYEKSCKFLGVTFDSNHSFTDHINDIVTRAKKRLNLLKALRGQSWGASPQTIIYSYRTYVRPLLEYSCILFSHTNNELLKKIQAVETQAIKIAFRLAPWATNTSCYDLVTFPKILTRLKSLFLNMNKNDELIAPLISESKMSIIGQHSAIYKVLNF